MAVGCTGLLLLRNFVPAQCAGTNLDSRKTAFAQVSSFAASLCLPENRPRKEGQRTDMTGKQDRRSFPTGRRCLFSRTGTRTA